MAADKGTIAVRNRAYHAANRQRLNARHTELRALRKASADADLWAVKKLVADARRRAAAKRLAFDLRAAEIIRPTHCPLLGVELVYQANGRRLPNSASIDRINSALGYLPSNVWLISWRANQIKSDATPNELRLIAEGLARAGAELDGIEHRASPP